MRLYANFVSILLVISLLHIVTSTDFYDASSDVRRAALMRFYAAFHGPSWTNNTLWGSSESIYNWYGIQAIPGTNQTSVSLIKNNLQGALSSANFCDFILELEIVSLLLGSNSISGQLPSCLCSLPPIANLDLSSNHLTGSLLGCLAPQNSTSITYGNNALSGNLEALCTQQRAIIIDLSSNLFSGSLPDCTAALSPSLSLLRLSNNPLLTGSITTSFLANVPQLQALNIDYTGIGGPLPANIWAALPILQEFTAANCNLSGGIPDTFVPGCQLYMMSLLQNEHLGGTLPRTLAYCTGLAELYLSSCNIAGTIPSSLNVGTFASMTKLALSGNRLSGNIQVLLTMDLYNSQLTVLQLSRNQFNGTIPEILFLAMPYISGVDLSQNNFEGQLASNLANTVQVSNLLLLAVDGNPRMVSADGTLPPGVIMRNSDSSASASLLWTCKELTVQGSLLVLRVDPSYLSFAHCRCTPGFYGLPPSNCTKAPNGALRTDGRQIVWPSGYYPVMDESGWVALLPCLDYGIATESNCAPQGAVLTWNPNSTITIEQGPLCSDGSSGLLCSQCRCDEGGNSTCHFFTGTRCEACRTVPVGAIVGIVCAVVAVAILIIIGIRCILQRRGKHLRMVQQHIGAPLKVVVTFVQITVSLGSEWSQGSLASVAVILGLVNQSTTGLGLECFWPAMIDPYNRYVFTLCLPLVVLGVALVVMIVLHLRQLRSTGGGGGGTHDRTSKMVVSTGDTESTKLLHFDGAVDLDQYIPSLLQRFMKAFLIVMYFFYYGTANATLAIFNCNPVAPNVATYNVQNIPWMQCWKAEWDSLARIGFVGIGVYVAGIPVLILALLLYGRRLQHNGQVHGVSYWLNTLTGSYRSSCSFFELVMIGRRLLLAVVLALLFPTSPFYVTATFLLLLIALAVHLVVQPFESKVANNVETFGLLVTIFIFALQVGFRFASSPSALSARLMSDGALGVNIAAVVVMVGVFVPHVIRSVRSAIIQ